MIKKILKIIVLILSKSPVFSITFDPNFDEVTRKILEDNNEKVSLKLLLKEEFNKSPYIKDKFRFSVVSLGFGVKKFYFLTYKGGFKKFKIIDYTHYSPYSLNVNLTDQQKENLKNYEDEEIEKIETRVGYFKFLADKDYEKIFKDSEEGLSYIEKQHIMEERREDKAETKASAIMAILLAIIPLYSSAMFKNIVVYWTGYSKILSLNSFRFFVEITIFYYFINAWQWNRSFFKVKKFVWARYSDLKSNEDKKKQYFINCYYNWKAQNIKSGAEVGRVDNMNSYFLGLVYSLVLGIFLTNINILMSRTSNIKGINDVVTLRNNKTEILTKKELEGILNINKELITNKSSTIFILRNGDTEDKEILELLKPYNINSFEIKTLIDEELEAGEIKIILN